MYQLKLLSVESNNIMSTISQRAVGTECSDTLYFQLLASVRHKDRRRQGGQSATGRARTAVWANSFGWLHHFVYDNLCCKSRFLTPIEVWAEEQRLLCRGVWQYEN
jgi:hypothetical protein